MADFFDFLRDKYKGGVEKQSATPVHYLDPNRIPGYDAKLVKEKVDLSSIPPKIDLTPGQRNFLAKHIAEQLDSYYVGMSEKLSQEQLILLLAESVSAGPFSDKAFKKDDGVCLINEPNGDEIDPDKIFMTFGLTGDQKPDEVPKYFKSEHMAPFPIDKDHLRRLVGEHEGEHCNQEGILVTDKDADIKTLKGETLSDRAALKTLREEGQEEAAQAWIDLRVLAAAEGDATHATSIFLNDPEFTGVNKEHLNAAKSFKDEMCRGVAEYLGIPLEKAENLRYLDPRAFTKVLDEGLKDGSIPLKWRNMDVEEAKNLMAQEMGISVEEFDKLGPEKIVDIDKLYDRLQSEGKLRVGREEPHDRLQSEGKLRVGREEPPYVRQYMEQYVGAVDRRFVANTTAAPEELNKEYNDKEPETLKLSSASELKDKMTEGDFQREAVVQKRGILDLAVAKEMGISKNEASRMSWDKPQEYYKLAEKLIDENKIPLQTDHARPADEHNTIMAEKLGVSVARINKMDPAKYQIIYDRMYSQGAFNVKVDNPELKKELKILVKASLELAKSVEVETTVETPDASEENGAEEESPNPLRTGHEPLNTSGDSSVKADMSGGDRAKITIGGMSVSDYFARQADPALVAQLEIERIRQASLAQSNSVTKLPSSDPALA